MFNCNKAYERQLEKQNTLNLYNFKVYRFSSQNLSFKDQTIDNIKTYLGDKENFIASDFSAILKYTNSISILENGEFAVIEENSVRFFDNNLSPRGNDIKIIETQDEDSEKNGYEHFMLKEINENTITVKKTLDEYINQDNSLNIHLF